MRSAASCCQPLQLISVPRGARTGRGPAVVSVLTMPPRFVGGCQGTRAPGGRPAFCALHQPSGTASTRRAVCPEGWTRFRSRIRERAAMLESLLGHSSVGWDATHRESVTLYANAARIPGGMIKSFRDAETEKVFNRRFSQRLPHDIQATALRKLRMLATRRRHRPAQPARQPPRATRWGPRRPTQHPHQRPVARLLPVAGRRRARGRASATTTERGDDVRSEARPGASGRGAARGAPAGRSASARTASGSLSACTRRRINEIVLGKRRVTAETALRLARYFGTTPQFWLGLQADYDLDGAADELGERLEREVQVRAKAS